MAGYHDRDGWIWMDGEMVPWREAKVHILTHAMHYASSVFEGERAYGGRIFKSREHSQRLIESGDAIDMPLPWEVDQIEAAKGEVLEANVEVPVLAGSGVTPESAPNLAKMVDGAIVGTFLKEGGDVRAPVDVTRVRELVDAWNLKA